MDACAYAESGSARTNDRTIRIRRDMRMQRLLSPVRAGLQMRPMVRERNEAPTQKTVKAAPTDINRHFRFDAPIGRILHQPERRGHRTTVRQTRGARAITRHVYYGTPTEWPSRRSKTSGFERSDGS
jgi:hypothetical protein